MTDKSASLSETRSTSHLLQEELVELRLERQQLQAEIAALTAENERLNGRLRTQAAELDARVNARTAELSATNQQLEKEVNERQQIETALRQRNQELALLNRVNHALNSTLDIDKVLITFMEEVRHLFQVTACSIWLVDKQADEIVCEQAIGPQGQSVIGWRLPLGRGIVGWVAQQGESQIVSDTRADPHYASEVDDYTRLEMRSILSVPIQLKQETLGTLQVLDLAVDRFQKEDLPLIETLATTAAIAIENARLYEQAQRDADTKETLLREVNHRVKNNLSAIIGLLYAEKRHAGLENRPIYQSVMQDLIYRIQGLVKVHDLLSAVNWNPLSLSELAEQIIQAALQALPPGMHVNVHVDKAAVLITPKQSTGVSLIVNELTVNSVKHGLIGNPEAKITVQIFEENDMIRLLFRDNGPGYPEEVLASTSYNVGLYLIHGIVRSDLRGEVSLYNEDGAVTAVLLPKAP